MDLPAPVPDRLMSFPLMNGSFNHAPSSLKRRLVVCCDGTYTASDTGRETNPSNIALLARVVARVGFAKDDSREVIPQVVYYQSGIGTGAMSLASKGIQGTLNNNLS